MHYDIVLKSLLRSSSMLRLLTGSEVIEWLNVEIPKPRLPRVDLLVDMADGHLHQRWMRASFHAATLEETLN